MFTKKFARDAAERATKSAAQVALLVLGAGQANVLTVDWANLGGLTAGAALLSLLTSFASSFTGDPESASAIR